MATKIDRLIWIDLEMTGLNTAQDFIIEIATIVTDTDLNIIAEGPEIAIFQPKVILDKMDPWCTKHHTRSGLVERILNSKVNVDEAEKTTLNFLNLHLKPGTSPMCGNSICQDRRFLFRCMPNLEAFFHYRNLDVSTVKELARAWNPEIVKGFKKKSKHLAMEDIKESISELQYYKDTFFKF